MMLDNDNSVDRADLAAQLRAKGMPAFEWSLGGDLTHVVVPLLQEGEEGYEINSLDGDLGLELHAILEHGAHNPYLFIATNSLESACDIGLMGEDIYGQFVGSAHWEHAAEVEDAIGLFRGFWENGDEWLRKWADGDLASFWGQDD